MPIRGEKRKKERNDNCQLPDEGRTFRNGNDGEKQEGKSGRSPSMPSHGRSQGLRGLKA